MKLSFSQFRLEQLSLCVKKVSDLVNQLMLRLKVKLFESQCPKQHWFWQFSQLWIGRINIGSGQWERQKMSLWGRHCRVCWGARQAWICSSDRCKGVHCDCCQVGQEQEGPFQEHWTIWSRFGGRKLCNWQCQAWPSFLPTPDWLD